MKKINRILTHPLYQKHFQAIQEAEKNRIFCRHTMEHFLDVARLMYIYNLEEQAGIPKSVIYAAALLHDIGRCEQITKGIPHNEAGAVLGREIMNEAGYSETEISEVCDAILHHRKGAEGEKCLVVYLYRADKKSRNCFACAASDECNWDVGKKNTTIEY